MSTTWATIRDKVTRATSIAHRAIGTAEACAAKVTEISGALERAQDDSGVERIVSESYRRQNSELIAEETALLRTLVDASQEKGVHADLHGSIRAFLDRYTIPQADGGLPKVDYPAIMRDNVSLRHNPFLVEKYANS